MKKNYLANKMILGEIHPMFSGGNSKRARRPSAHQKRIRFFIGFLICLIIVLTAGLFWLLNQPWKMGH
jgi:hypothetical protein